MNRKTVIIGLSISLALLLIIGGFATNNWLRSQEIQKQVDLGNKYLEEGDYDQAKLAYEAAIQVDSRNIPARAGLAEVFIETGQYDDASRVITEIESLGYANITMADTIRISDAYLKHGRLDDAVKLLVAVQKAANNTEIKARLDDLMKSADISFVVSNPSLAVGDSTEIRMQIKAGDGQLCPVKASWNQSPGLGTIHNNPDGSIVFTAIQEGETTLTADIEGISWTTTLNINAVKITGLIATAESYEAISLSWDANPNAAGYKVFRRDNQGGQYIELSTVMENGYRDSGLTAETAYWYRVQGVAANGKEGLPAEASATTPKKDEMEALRRVVSARLSEAHAVYFTYSKEECNEKVDELNAQGELTGDKCDCVVWIEMESETEAIVRMGQARYETPQGFIWGYRLSSAGNWEECSTNVNWW